MNTVSMRHLLPKQRIAFCFIVLFCSTWPSFGQSDSTALSAPDTIDEEIPSPPSIGIFELLTKNQISNVTITTQFSTFLENKRHQDYLKGKFSFEASKGVEMTIPVKLRLRGRYRRMKCQFPPLKLKFKKDDLAAHDLNEFNELKLVTHCLDDESTSRDLVIREYMVYRLFNVICENSFRAHLVDVTYKNTRGKPKKIRGFGILIEDADELAHRISGEITDKVGVADSLINPKQEALVALFQYMIGNTDWSIMLNRNVELIARSEGDIYAIPYDFDFSGLVAAPYARPRTDIGQLTVRQRIFQGQATTAADLHDAIHIYLEKKEAILKEVDDFELLNKESKEDMKKYIEEFYTSIETEHAIMENLFPIEHKE